MLLKIDLYSFKNVTQLLHQNNIVLLYFLIGIVFANGDSWKEMRRFALTNLRDFGMGKKASEEKIIEEVHYLIEVFEEHKGKVLISITQSK